MERYISRQSDNNGYKANKRKTKGDGLTNVWHVEIGMPEHASSQTDTEIENRHSTQRHRFLQTLTNCKPTEMNEEVIISNHLQLNRSKK